MKFVKIIIVLTMVVFGFVCISKLYATDKQSYPIKIDEVLSNKEDLNPAYSVREDVALNGNQTVFIITDDNENEVLSISSAEINGNQLLNVGFMPFHSENPVKLEDCEEILMFVSKLSGLFKSDRSLYDTFINECGVKNTEFAEYEINNRSPLPQRKQDIIWKGKVDGIYCSIKLSEPANDDAWFLSTITLATDKSFVYTDNK
ncbi:MAG: hypothetical protein IJF29_02070 [Firmicutes bacterium]|nr:hypothetical protein [Bacillota bacterium]